MTTLPEPSETSDADAALRAAAEVLEAEVDVDPALAAEMEALDNDRRLLLVHAHPDDETICNGATMAKYAAAGARVTLVTCTLGEEGEILVPELTHLAADREDGLGRHRIGELATAMEALGVGDFRFLGGPGRYRDSGMIGTPSNSRPDTFWQADLDEAAGHLVEVIREVRPQVLVTYDDNGGYGHPDHIQAHRVAMRAAELAADPSYRPGEPWSISKTYEIAFSESEMREGLRSLEQSGAGFDVIDLDGGDLEAERPTFLVPDEEITTTIDASDFLEAKLAAMRAYATQIRLSGSYFALSNNQGSAVRGIEHYKLVKGERGPAARPDGREDDLFAGTNGPAPGGAVDIV